MAVGVRGCMEVLSECEANYDHTGAMWVPSIFLGVFALLLLGDCYLTWRALNGALLRDTDAIKRAQEELQSELSQCHPSLINNRPSISPSPPQLNTPQQPTHHPGLH